mgnify:FL=1|jgi:hypothetical protein
MKPLHLILIGALSMTLAAPVAAEVDHPLVVRGAAILACKNANSGSPDPAEIWVALNRKSKKGGIFLSTTLKWQIGFNVDIDPRNYTLEHPVDEPLSINRSELTVRWRSSSYVCGLSSTTQIDSWIAENVAAPLI